MESQELQAVFDKMAPSYDKQWIRMAPINEALHMLMAAAFSGLPGKARILCVGAGTGAEILYLAQRFPDWTFMALDPSAAMLEVCRSRLREKGLEARCEFHAGYLETLDTQDQFDAATAMLVSQFLLDREVRTDFFRQISERLKPGGKLVNSDLTGNLESETDQGLLEIWLTVMRDGGVSREELDRMRAAYQKDVGVLPEQQVAEIIMAAGFDKPVQIYQAGLIHAWCSTNARAER